MNVAFGTVDWSKHNLWRVFVDCPIVNDEKVASKTFTQY